MNHPFRPLFVEVDLEAIRKEARMGTIETMAYLYKRIYLDVHYWNEVKVHVWERSR